MKTALFIYAVLVLVVSVIHFRMMRKYGVTNKSDYFWAFLLSFSPMDWLILALFYKELELTLQERVR